MFYNISGFFLGLGPIIGFGIIGMAIYASLPNALGVLSIGVLICLGAWLGYSIFKKVTRVGPIELMTALSASPELDNLIPVADSDTQLLAPSEYACAIKKKENRFTGGSIRVYGDWFGMPYAQFHEIETADYKPLNKELIIRFIGGEVLTISRPKHIFDSTRYMKILNADAIRLEWLSHDEVNQKDLNYLYYKKIDQQVNLETNIVALESGTETSLGDPAIVIYG